jgi:glyoxylase-like metal-dependent hydrolase (beta-lactamase superfamily II)
VTALREVLAPNPSPMTLDGTRSFVIGRARPLVIDPGPLMASHLNAILAALGGVRPQAILLTHAHADHAESAPALRAATGAPVLLAPGWHHLPFSPAALDGTIADGDAWETDAGTVTAMATPGHSPDHVAFLWTGPEAGAGALVAGDLFMGVGDTTLVAPPAGDLADYLASLDRVEAAAPATIHPSHGPAIGHAGAAVERYRAHRMARIAQAREALRAVGRATPDALLDAVYGDTIDARLRPAAAASLAAILHYLHATGEARALPGGAYTPAEPE